MRIHRDALIETATTVAGYSDFGDPDFVDGLDALIAAIGEDQALREDQRTAVEGRLVGPLVQRLNLAAQRKEHPEIAGQSIVAPLIVIGLPRSGTTFLHALLAQDPEARSPLAWQLSDLSSPPRAETIDSDPRISAVDAMQARLPDDFKRMHLVGATLPDECNTITMLSFLSPNFDAGLDVPSYRRWFMDADARPAYRTHRHVLQHLQAFTTGSHWVLKAPPHMFHLAALLETYPDARIIFPHRDPAATIPSLTSLITAIRRWTYEHVDQAAIGRAQMEFWAIAIERVMEFRAGLRDPRSFLDVAYDSLVAQPMAAVEAIYDHFGLSLSSAAETAMHRFLADKPKDQHGAHRYSLSDAGLSRAEVHARFAPYLSAHFPALAS